MAVKLLTAPAKKFVLNFGVQNFECLGVRIFVRLAWFHVNEKSKRTNLPRSKICPVPCERSLKIMKLSANYR